MKYNCLPKVFPRILFLSRRAYCSLHRIKASQKFIEKKIIKQVLVFLLNYCKEVQSLKFSFWLVFAVHWFSLKKLMWHSFPLCNLRQCVQEWTNKICGRHPLKKIKWNGLLKKMSSTNFTWSIFKYVVPFVILFPTYI